ncbi:MAG: DUF554 domain-containing protein [Clostridia bacterium]|nr:DUF554 domain-containing protein [Clostridia bacterium]
MLGVIVNVITVIIGSTIGLLFKKGIPERISKAVMTGIGLCTIYIGISGVIECKDPLTMIISIVLGVAIGTLFRIDDGINKIGAFISSKFKKSGKNSAVAEGFVTACLVFCIGAMTITGSIEAGLNNNNDILFTKSLLDLVSSAMLSVSLGVGVIFAALFVLIFQGGLVLLSQLLSGILTDPAIITSITSTGGLLILALGLNIIGVTKIKVADFLPAIVISPFVYSLLQMIMG